MSEQENDIHAWGLPDVTTNEMLEREFALGYDPSDKTELSSSEETPKVGVLTAADLEEIRQAAYQEGLEQGKEDGFAQGYQEGQTKGHEDGLTQGKAQGRQEGLAEGQAEIDAQSARWEALIAAMAAPLRELDQKIEHQLVQLTAQLAKAVVRTELKSNDKVVLAGLREAISILNVTDGAVRIALPPDDVALITEQYGEQGLAERNWHLLAEPELNSGQLQVEHNISHVEVDLHERLEATLQRFLAQLARPQSEDTPQPEDVPVAEPSAEVVPQPTSESPPPTNEGFEHESQPED